MEFYQDIPWMIRDHLLLINPHTTASNSTLYDRQTCVTKDLISAVRQRLGKCAYHKAGHCGEAISTAGFYGAGYEIRHAQTIKTIAVRVRAKGFPFPKMMDPYQGCSERYTVFAMAGEPFNGIVTLPQWSADAQKLAETLYKRSLQEETFLAAVGYIIRSGPATFRNVKIHESDLGRCLPSTSFSAAQNFPFRSIPQQQPTTMALYDIRSNRNDGPPKLIPLVWSKEIKLAGSVLGEDLENTTLLGHPNACLVVASLDSFKSEDHFRRGVADLFSRWGVVLDVKVLKDCANRPFSFVLYTTAEEASYALEKCQTEFLDGKMIRVEWARVNRTLHVSKDKGEIDEATIKALLEPFGQIEEIVMPGSRKRSSNEVSDGCFARFVFRDDATKAYHTLGTSENYSIAWAQNLDRSSTATPGGIMPEFPIDYSSIFIDQLDCATSENDVRGRFGKYRTVIGVQVLAKAATVGRRPPDDVVTGFAFVKYENRGAATKAVNAENGAVFHGRTIRVQYRELHQDLHQSTSARDSAGVTPKVAPPPTREFPSSPLQQSQQPPRGTASSFKVPATLDQISWTGSLESDASNDFGAFEPVTDIENINPQFFAAYNSAPTAANTPTSTSSTPLGPPAPNAEANLGEIDNYVNPKDVSTKVSIANRTMVLPSLILLIILIALKEVNPQTPPSQIRTSPSAHHKVRQPLSQPASTENLMHAKASFSKETFLLKPYAGRLTTVPPEFDYTEDILEDTSLAHPVVLGFDPKTEFILFIDDSGRIGAFSEQRDYYLYLGDHDNIETVFANLDGPRTESQERWIAEPMEVSKTSKEDKIQVVTSSQEGAARLLEDDAEVCSSTSLILKEKMARMTMIWRRNGGLK